MIITKVNVRKAFDKDPLRAIVSITLDGELAVHDIKVIHAAGKHFIVMPSRKLADGTFCDVAHPIKSEFRSQIESAVLGAYFAEIEEKEERQ